MTLISLSRSLAALALLALVAACAPSVDSANDRFGTDFSKPAPGTFEDPAIDGPNVVGVWNSACVVKDYGYGSRRVSIQYKNDAKFNYTNTLYLDLGCRTLEKIETHAGDYQFTEEKSDSLYRIDYKYVERGVTYIMKYQQLETSGGAIFISEFVFSGFQVNRNLPLLREGAPPAPVPTTCTSYAGKYQMNGVYLRIEQTGCQQFDWINENFSGRPETRESYITDGRPRSVSGTMVTARFNAKGLLELETTSSAGEQILNVFSYQKRPCNLANPDGTDLLTRNVFVNGVERTSNCKFWDRQN